MEAEAAVGVERKEWMSKAIRVGGGGWFIRKVVGVPKSHWLL